MESFGCKQLVEDPTRVTAGSKSLIDVAFSDVEQLKCEVLLTPKVSDHDIVCIGECGHSKEDKRIWMKGSLNMDKFRMEVKRRMMGGGMDDGNGGFENFIEIIRKRKDDATGEDRRVRFRPCPWFTEKVKTAIKRSCLLYTSPSPRD